MTDNKNEPLEALHEAVTDLHDAGVMDDEVKEKFDDICGRYSGTLKELAVSPTSERIIKETFIKRRKAMQMLADM